MSPAVNFRHQYARRVEERGAYSRKIADLDRQFFFSMIIKFSHSVQHNGKELIIFPSLFHRELNF